MWAGEPRGPAQARLMARMQSAGHSLRTHDLDILTIIHHAMINKNIIETMQIVILNLLQ